ncbi:apolipoprotein D-like [Cimex lectularius]|uniref:Lipocalin/cytosolic fatty-acid binding domain-containing protein n=1 Tax=Cimex lectularius TaxID=79782 RepID=A0A8I6R8X1_CIMLE|nr:apolipoprotein D-like [Cimex lectularius]
MKTQVTLAVVCLMASLVKAQIPGIGWCPDKRAMAGFDIDRYMGTWYEAERYFTVLEAGSRCARTNYTKAADGRILVTNEITNRITGIKRVLDGEIRNVPKGGLDSKISVKYSTLPFPMETEYSILDTDYDSYSVVWSCSGIGPLVNTQSAWVMTRDRLPPGTVLQKAYGVLDKHKISRTFFVRAEQEECNLGEPLGPPLKTKTADPEASPEPTPVAKPEASPEANPVPSPSAQPEPKPVPSPSAHPEVAVMAEEAKPLVQEQKKPAVTAPVANVVEQQN